jgi:hypothetical protein
MITRFLRDRRGSALERYAIGGLVATLGAFFVGHAVEQYSTNGELPSLAFLEPGFSSTAKSKSTKFNSIDYVATGSTRGQVVILDPCTGQQKN